MKYEVDWTDDALAALAAIWVDAADRKAVNAAQTRIERVLAVNPLAGVHVSEGLYAFNEIPLRVQFEVVETSRVVTIVSVRTLP